MKKLFPLVLINFLFVWTGFAQLGGETVFNSLNIPASARVASLGGNLMSVKDGDLNLGIFNPSLLDSNMHRQMALSYVNYFSDVNLGFASYAHRLDSLTTLAATIQYVDYGEFTERDVSGQDIGAFNAGDYALIIGAGRQIDSVFSVGANLKLLYSTIAQFSSTAGAVDLSGTYHSKRRQFTASLMIRNVGTQFKTFNEDTREPLPFEVQLGISKRLKHAPLRFSLVAENLQQWDLIPDAETETVQIDPISGEVIESNRFEFGDQLMRHLVFGTEILITDNFNIRVGYNYRRRQELKVADRPGTAGLSWGVAFRISRFQISYGRATYHLAGPSNHFSISTNLGPRT